MRSTFRSRVRCCEYSFCASRSTAWASLACQSSTCRRSSAGATKRPRQAGRGGRRGCARGAGHARGAGMRRAAGRTLVPRPVVQVMPQLRIETIALQRLLERAIEVGAVLDDDRVVGRRHLGQLLPLVRPRRRLPLVHRLGLRLTLPDRLRLRLLLRPKLFGGVRRLRGGERLSLELHLPLAHQHIAIYQAGAGPPLSPSYESVTANVWQLVDGAEVESSFSSEVVFVGREVL